MKDQACPLLKSQLEKVRRFVKGFNSYLEQSNVEKALEQKIKIEECLKKIKSKEIIEKFEDRAREIMGANNFIGKKELEQVFGIPLSYEHIPLIPFTTDELQKAKDMGFKLILYYGKNPKTGMGMSSNELAQILKNNKHEINIDYRDTLISQGKQLFDTLMNAESFTVKWALVADTDQYQRSETNFIYPKLDNAMNFIKIFFDKINAPANIREDLNAIEKKEYADLTDTQAFDEFLPDINELFYYLAIFRLSQGKKLTKANIIPSKDNFIWPISKTFLAFNTSPSQKCNSFIADTLSPAGQNSMGLVISWKK